MSPAAAGAAREFLPADAYEQYWDCLESDTPAGEDSPTADDLPSDAYGQFWQLNDA
jgi:hypothetical protein